MNSLRIRVTGKRVLLGTGLSILFTLQCIGQVRSHKWTATQGVVFAIASVALSWAAALTAQRRPRDAQARVATRRQFRNTMLVWVAAVLFFLLAFKVLDALHIRWQQYVP